MRVPTCASASNPVAMRLQEMYKEVADIDSWRAPIFYPLHVWHPDVDQGSLREHWKHWDEERQLLHQGFQQDVSSNVWSVDWCYGTGYTTSSSRQAFCVGVTSPGASIGFHICTTP